MIRDLDAASAGTVLAALDAANKAFWEDRDIVLGRAQQAAYALASPPRLAAWQQDLREAAARLRLFPWYFYQNLGAPLTGDLGRDFPHPGFNDVEDS